MPDQLRQQPLLVTVQQCAVALARVRQVDAQVFADPAGVGIHHDDPVAQVERLFDRGSGASAAGGG